MRITVMLDGVALFDSGNRDMAADAVKALAVAYCGMDSDAQAKFFEEVGQIMNAWETPGSPSFVRYGAFDVQAIEIGQHMWECTCVSEMGREFFRRVAYGLEHASPTSPSEARPNS